VATTNVDVRSDKLFSGGKGTKDNPYQIRTYDELWNVRNFMNNAKVYFLLLSDIDAAGKGWKSIGDYTKYTGDDTNRKFFMGNLDGNGFIIKNLNITETAIFHQSFITTAAMDDGWPLNGDISGDVQLAGLFGVTSRIYDPEAEALIGGTITNLGVKNVTIDLDYDNSPFQFLSGLMCGGLVARPAMCLIENCFVTGAMSGKLYGTTEWYNFDEATILSIGGIIAGFEKTGRKGRKEFYMPTDAVGTIENSYASVTTSADLKINRENAKKGLFESFEVVTKGAIKPQSEDKRIKVIHSYYDSTKESVSGGGSPRTSSQFTDPGNVLAELNDYAKDNEMMNTWIQDPETGYPILSHRQVVDFTVDNWQPSYDGTPKAAGIKCLDPQLKEGLDWSYEYRQNGQKVENP
ncbi:MAG: hypothetical protein RR614_06365, partial [Eubacterium sp.]